MTRKVILYIAISIDGMIADVDGNIDWLTSGLEFTEEDSSYDDFYTNIDTVVLGKKTYDQVTEVLSPGVYPYEDVKSYVFTNKNLVSTKDNISFVNGNIAEFIEQTKNTKGKDIWIVGGASLVKPLVEHNLIDEYQITIIPKILGKGIRLFNEMDEVLQVEFKDTRIVNGMLSYKAVKL